MNKSLQLTIALMLLSLPVFAQNKDSKTLEWKLSDSASRYIIGTVNTKPYYDTTAVYIVVSDSNVPNDQLVQMYALKVKKRYEHAFSNEAPIYLQWWDGKPIAKKLIIWMEKPRKKSEYEKL